MKKFFVLCIFIILLVTASGCTQPATTTTPTPAPTTVVVTAVPTPEVTMPPTTAQPTAETTPAVTATVTKEVTSETTTAVTAVATVKPELTHSKTTTIYIRNNTFVPKEMMVLPGTGVRWVNEDKTAHMIKTLPDTKIKFTSSDMVNGASFSYTFGENEGTFGFFDTYSNATGVIIVKKGAAVVGAPPMQTHVTTAATP